MRSPRSVCSSGSSHTAHSLHITPVSKKSPSDCQAKGPYLPMKVRSRRVRDRSMSSTPAMPLADRGGTCESSVALLRSGCDVKPFPVLKLLLAPREPGRIPARKDMSGPELEDNVWCRYCAGPPAIQSQRPWASSCVRLGWSFCASCPGGRGRRDLLRFRTVAVSGGEDVY
jgi:hypothetical protein